MNLRNQGHVVTPRAKPQFEKKAQAGFLMVRTTNGSPVLLDTSQIDKIYIDHADDLTLLDRNGKTYLHSNFYVVSQAFVMARNTGESFDLRDICSLSEDDPLRKEYRRNDAGEAVLSELRSRVKRYAPEPFPHLK